MLRILRFNIGDKQNFEKQNAQTAFVDESMTFFEKYFSCLMSILARNWHFEKNFHSIQSNANWSVPEQFPLKQNYNQIISFELAKKNCQFFLSIHHLIRIKMLETNMIQFDRILMKSTK